MSNCCGVKLRVNGEQITLFEEFCTSKVVLSRLVESREGDFSFKIKFNSTQLEYGLEASVYFPMKLESPAYMAAEDNNQPIILINHYQHETFGQPKNLMEIK